MFYDWMMEKYFYSDLKKRVDLADHMDFNKNFPRVDDRKVILNYLKKEYACEACIEVFKLCWRDYKRHLRKQKE